MEWLLEVTEMRGLNQNKIGLLYDIGCNIEKGKIKVSLIVSQFYSCWILMVESLYQRDQFARARAEGRLKFGTSVFHAYVHEWLCQLVYNPRLIAGWGLSDGEGLERIWSCLSPLISPLRYSTSQHRLESLSLRSIHHNEMSRHKAGRPVSLSCFYLFII